MQSSSRKAQLAANLRNVDGPQPVSLEVFFNLTDNAECGSSGTISIRRRVVHDCRRHHIHNGAFPKLGSFCIEEGTAVLEPSDYSLKSDNVFCAFPGLRTIVISAPGARLLQSRLR